MGMLTSRQIRFKEGHKPIKERCFQRLVAALVGKKFQVDIVDSSDGVVIAPKGIKVTVTYVRRILEAHDTIDIEPSAARVEIMKILFEYEEEIKSLERKLGIIQDPEELKRTG